MRIEAALGRGVLKVAQDMQEADMSATDMITILTPILRSTGKDLNDKDVGNIIWEQGFAEALRAVAEVMAFILTSGSNEGNVVEAGSQ